MAFWHCRDIDDLSLKGSQDNKKDVMEVEGRRWMSAGRKECAQLLSRGFDKADLLLLTSVTFVGTKVVSMCTPLWDLLSLINSDVDIILIIIQMYI